ncbi:MAG: 30S ribosomal protein S17 [Patescibacteria group bacterium]|jgi:small subunit ribosomal protein S17
MTEQETKHRQMKGVVVSDKMEKTIVVRVERTVLHPKYLKRYAKSERYKVHDEKEEASVGDTVIVEETRPLSKEKCWRLISIVK